MFSYEFCEMFKNTNFIKDFQWLILWLPDTPWSQDVNRTYIRRSIYILCLRGKYIWVNTFHTSKIELFYHSDELNGLTTSQIKRQTCNMNRESCQLRIGAHHYKKKEKYQAWSNKITFKETAKSPKKIYSIN